MSKNENILEGIQDFIVNIIIGCVFISIVCICYLSIRKFQGLIPGYTNFSWTLIKLSAAVFFACIILLNFKKIVLFIGGAILKVFKHIFCNIKLLAPAPKIQNLSTTPTRIKADGTPLKEGLPPLSLLGDVVETKSSIDKSLPKKVESMFEVFELPIKVKSYVAGASITKFMLDMDKSVRIKNLMALKDDMALQLHVDSINLVPSKEGMALEVPNKNRRMVYHRMVMESLRNEQFKELSVILGERSTGEPFYFDLEDAPHLLVAGATGMGKSVCINTIICSFLMRLPPDQLQLLLIDPKQVEFKMYEPLPHLARPVVKGSDGGIDALKWCVEEMERRYKILDDRGIKKLHSIPVDKRPFPLIIIIVDELADLILSSGKEVNNLISRLAGKARAAGMHLILATQRPSADIISGLIRSNILGRIALKTDKAIESSIILDCNGAETLTGKGELLVKMPGYNDLVRCQGSFIDDENMAQIVGWWKDRTNKLSIQTQKTNTPLETNNSKIVFNLSEPDDELDCKQENESQQYADFSSVELLLRNSICQGVIENDIETEIIIPPIRDLAEELNTTTHQVRCLLEKLKTDGWLQTVGSTKSSKNIVILSKDDAAKWLSEIGN